MDDMSNACFLCGSVKYKRIGLIRGHTIQECSKCGVQFLNPVPCQKRLEDIYSDYYKAWDIASSEKEVSKMKTLTFKSYINRVKPYISSGAMLDVGCATGELMSVAEKAGFEVYGAEISPYGVLRCRKQFGDTKIIGRSLREGDFPLGFFHLITLSDILEHIPNPRLFLNMLWKMLAPKGYLMIITPDTLSWMCKIMGRYWFHYKEEHIYYYNSRNIVKVLNPYFKILECNRAYKTLTMNYCIDVLNTYSTHSILKSIAAILKYIPPLIRFYPIRISIGESFILCRKE